MSFTLLKDLSHEATDVPNVSNSHGATRMVDNAPDITRCLHWLAITSQ